MGVRGLASSSCCSSSKGVPLHNQQQSAGVPDVFESKKFSEPDERPVMLATSVSPRPDMHARPHIHAHTHRPNHGHVRVTQRPQVQQPHQQHYVCVSRASAFLVAGFVLGCATVLLIVSAAVITCSFDVALSPLVATFPQPTLPARRSQPVPASDCEPGQTPVHVHTYLHGMPSASRLPVLTPTPHRQHAFCSV